MPERRASKTDEPRGTWEGYWKREETEFLRDNYKAMSDSDIAKILGKTTKSVKSHRNYLGLLHGTNRKPWTIEEVTYLIENWGEKTIHQIAKNLGRTPAAVKTRAIKEGLGRQLGNGELLCKEQIADMMGYRRRETVDDWIQKGLKARYKSISLGKRQSGSYIIKFSDLLYFLEHNQDAWDSRRLPKYGLGVEYEWLKKKREKDSHRPIMQRNWTTRELDYLKIWVGQKRPYKEIAKELGRTVTGVRSMSARMGYTKNRNKNNSNKKINNKSLEK